MADNRSKGDESVTKLELMGILKEHNGQHHDLDIKITNLNNRIEKLEEKLDSAVKLAKWAVPIIIMVAAILEHAIISLITGVPQ